MRVLVTGGAGMVGSNAAEYFVRKKCRVIALDNLMRSKLFGAGKKSVEHNWRYLSKYKKIERVKGDIRDKDLLKRLFKKGIDAVIHAAAQPGAQIEDGGLCPRRKRTRHFNRKVPAAGTDIAKAPDLIADPDSGGAQTRLRWQRIDDCL